MKKKTVDGFVTVAGLEVTECVEQRWKARMIVYEIGSVEEEQV